MALALLSSSSLAIHNFTRQTTRYFLRPFANLSRNLNKNDPPPPKPPKRPLTPFFDFLKSIRQNIVANNPGISQKDVVRRSAEMYKNLSEVEKKVLKDQSAERMKVYKVQYHAFKESLTPEQAAAIKTLRLKKKENRAKRKKKEIERKNCRPKRPMNAYAIFTRASKVERGTIPFVQYSRRLATIWKNMPKDEKAIYLEEARLERERYVEEMVYWERAMVEKGQPEIVRGYRKPTRSTKKKATPKSTKKVTRKRISKKTTVAKSTAKKTSK